MKLRKVIAALLSVTIIGSVVTVAASASDVVHNRTFHYVALGDSITAGYGLTGTGDTIWEEFATDRSIFLTEERLADPIQEAYPAVFGEMLEKKGAKLGFKTETANLATTAYRADDVAKTILEEDYTSALAASMTSMAGLDSQEVFNNYHGIMTSYLSEADLVTIQLGGNDVLLGFLDDLDAQKNPILGVLETALYMILIGADGEESLNIAYSVLEQYKDQITKENVVAAMEYLAGIEDKMADSVANAAAKVKDVVDAVRSVNSKTEIAVVGMFDPYGNSLEYDGQVRNFCNVARNIISRAVKELSGVEVVLTAPKDLTDKEAEGKIHEINKKISEIKVLIDLDFSKKAQKEKLNKLMAIVTDELAYPLQYMLIGKNVDSLMTALNLCLQNVALTTNSDYVDVYSISNELGLDPHPNAKGHREIAELMYSSLSGKLTEAMIYGNSTGEITKEYNYVAFGDSIAAGFGLTKTESLATDPALILSQNLIDNPVAEAYPAVFGDYLKKLGELEGIKVNATNLSSTAYRAEDIARTIVENGYKGEVAEYILETFVGKGASAVLEKYHDIYNKYLPDADLVSIQLGGNDIVMAIIYPMIKSDNIIFKAISASMALVLFGLEPKLALGAGLQIIQQSKDKITFEMLSETASYFAGISQNAETYVDYAAENVKNVAQAVRSVNSDTDIALVGMYNPYGNSLEYNETTYNLSTVMSNIFTEAASMLCGCDPGSVDVNVLTADNIKEMTEKSSARLLELSKLSEKMANIKSCSKKAAEKIKKNITNLISVVKNEISYPLQYMTLGNNVDPQMVSLNAKFQALAAENGYYFVDTYNISNENNLDPHPTAKGHREIAEFMKAELSDVVVARMNAELSADSLVNRSTVSADVDVLPADDMKKITAESSVRLFELSKLSENIANIKSYSKKTAEKIKEKITNLLDADPLVNRSTVSGKKIRLGKKVKVKGIAEGGSGTYQYAFYYKKASSTKWTKVHDFSSVSTVNIVPGAAVNYDILVKVRDLSGKITTKTLTLKVTK